MRRETLYRDLRISEERRKNKEEKKPKNETFFLIQFSMHLFLFLSIWLFSSSSIQSVLGHACESAVCVHSHARLLPSHSGMSSLWFSFVVLLYYERKKENWVLRISTYYQIWNWMDTVDSQTRSNVPGGILGLFLGLIFICVRKEIRRRRRLEEEEK